MNVKTSFVMAAAVVYIATGASAQKPAQLPQPPKSYTTELTALAERIGKDFQVRIVVDPAVFVPVPPTDPGEIKSVDEAMVKLLGYTKTAAWRRVYLTRSEATSGIPAAKLAAMVRAIDSLQTGGLVIEDPGTRRACSLQKNLPVMPGFSDELVSLSFEPTPVYVLYSTLGGGSGGTLQDKLLDLQRQQYELLMQMDPDTLASAMSQSMQMLMALDPQTRSRIMGNMMQGSMRMLTQMDPRTRNEMVAGMIRTSMETWNSMPEQDRKQFTQEMMRMGQELGQQFGQQGGGMPGRP